MEQPFRGDIVMAKPSPQDAPPPSAALFLCESQGMSQEVSTLPIVTIDHRVASFITPDGKAVDEVGGFPIYYFRRRTFAWLFLVGPCFGPAQVGGLIVPPSSIKALLGSERKPGYLETMAAKYGGYEIVWTSFRLEKVESGIHCVLVPAFVAALSDTDKVRKLLAIRNQVMAFIETMRDLPPAPQEADIEATGND
jgi:hypothetical protein